MKIAADNHITNQMKFRMVAHPGNKNTSLFYFVYSQVVLNTAIPKAIEL